MIGQIIIGASVYFFLRCILFGFFTVDQNERAVKTIYGKAEVINDKKTSETSLADSLTVEERARYAYPMVRVIGPGLHFKFPWEQVYTISIATETIDMAYDPENPRANSNGTMLEAVTRDQLNVGLKGQIRYRPSSDNLYACLFGIKQPIVHVMGFYVSILRELIANFHKDGRPVTAADANVNDNSVQTEGVNAGMSVTEAVSINDLRKNLRDINDVMVQECISSAARYGILLDASLITSIEPPPEVESALAAINTAHNNVSSEISLAKATADQTIVLSKRAVEIETLKAQAEVEPLKALAAQLKQLKSSGPDVLGNFVRNVRLATFSKAQRVIINKPSRG
jgi:regulator of protease activity HflC (stomatin/prohibitin superfamily)